VVSGYDQQLSQSVVSLTLTVNWITSLSNGSQRSAQMTWSMPDDGVDMSLFVNDSCCNLWRAAGSRLFTHTLVPRPAPRSSGDSQLQQQDWAIDERQS